MAFHLAMPRVGDTMEKGTVLRWLKADGDWVNEGEPLVEIETEKVALEVPAPAAGYLNVVAPEETELAPGATMAYLLEMGEESPVAAVAQVDTSQKIQVDTSQRPAGTEPSVSVPDRQEPPATRRVSPVAKKLAAEHGVNLHALIGSGPDGRIIERDVREWIATHAGAETEPPSAVAPAPELATDPSAGAPVPQMATSPAALTMQAVPYAGLRKAVGERMQKSLHEMAQLTISRKADVTQLDELRANIAAACASTAPRLTYTDFVVKAVALALREHPRLNSRLADGAVQLIAEINIGLAIAVDGGLMVGVIPDAVAKPLGELARARVQLAGGAREGRLALSEISGGTFTVSTLGAWGVDFFTPIVNPPECAILGVGVVEETLALIDGQVAPRRAMRLSLSFDHRILDGVPAALFLSGVCDLLEQPYALVV